MREYSEKEYPRSFKCLKVNCCKKMKISFTRFRHSGGILCQNKFLYIKLALQFDCQKCFLCTTISHKLQKYFSSKQIFVQEVTINLKNIITKNQMTLSNLSQAVLLRKYFLSKSFVRSSTTSAFHRRYVYQKFLQSFACSKLPPNVFFNISCIDGPKLCSSRKHQENAHKHC